MRHERGDVGYALVGEQVQAEVVGSYGAGAAVMQCLFALGVVGFCVFAQAVQSVEVFVGPQR